MFVFFPKFFSIHYSFWVVNFSFSMAVAHFFGHKIG